MRAGSNRTSDDALDDAGIGAVRGHHLPGHEGLAVDDELPGVAGGQVDADLGLPQDQIVLAGDQPLDGGVLHTLRVAADAGRGEGVDHQHQPDGEAQADEEGA